MYHIFFIHSSVYGHFGCFNVFAVVNCAVMYIGVHVVLSFQAICPRMGLFHHDNSVFSFLRSLHTVFSVLCSPESLYQCTFPTTVQESSLFSTPFPFFIICRLFDDGNYDWCEVIPQCSLDLHF